MSDIREIFKALYSRKPDAVAKIRGGEEYKNIEGQVNFYQLNYGVIVAADIENLPKTETNIFAFHVHEGQSCKDNFAETGGHYNPQNVAHPLHAGDLPPLFSSNQEAFLVTYTNRFKVSEVIGKTVIIHNSYDDFTTQPAGNSGQKIACGEIKKG